MRNRRATLHTGWGEALATQPLNRTSVQVLAHRASGAYECAFTPQQAGRVAVLVQLRGEGVGGSPFFVQIAAGPTAAPQCSLTLAQAAPPMALPPSSMNGIHFGIRAPSAAAAVPPQPRAAAYARRSRLPAPAACTPIDWLV